MVGTVAHVVPAVRTPKSQDEVRRAPVLALLRHATDLFRSGRYLDAMHGFEVTRTAALHDALSDLAARALGNIGGCQFALHQYPAALGSFQQTIREAKAAGDTSAVAVFNANISSLYTEMGELETAAQWMQNTLARLSSRDQTQRPKMLIQLAIIRARQRRMDDAKRLFSEGIGAGDWETAAQGWHRLGEEYLNQHKLAEAEGPLLEAYRIRQLHSFPLDASYRCLGRLKVEQGDLDSAATLLDRAIQGGIPTWDMFHYRGRVRLEQGRLAEALDDLRIAIRLAREWRWSILPEDAARIGAEGELHAVHAALVDAGNRLYQRTHDPALIRETFEAAEENRANSLRALLRSHEIELRNSFPPEYWEALARLQRAEVQTLRTGSGGDSLSAARADLARMESSMGPAVAPLPPAILERAQRHLGGDTALLSFQLGDRTSWLWTLDRSGLTLQELPARDRIEAQLRGHSGELWHTLFSQLPPRAKRASKWLVAWDGGLFTLSLAALREPDGAFVAERRTVETIPGAGYWVEALERPHPKRTNLFVGIGDAIYNTADPRRQSTSAASTKPPLQLPRLVASGAELDESAAAWNGDHVLLKGVDASRDRLRAQLARQPAVIHFATHVVESGNPPSYGLIALSLNSRQENELISPYEITGWRTGAGLIVLSGCNSGEGEVLPGTGLLGLTRAWLTAGARSVIASNWSTPDASGALFHSLYRNLANRPDAGPAEALRAAQLEMIRSGDWRANPRYWGAFFVTGAQ
jgi:CHAT domain-containing protein/tetratricopeptide (TPR) repeat protein